MEISEDQTVYLADFGVSCTSGGTTAKAILEQPDLVLAGNQIISTDYQLTARVSDFGSLKQVHLLLLILLHIQLEK